MLIALFPQLEEARFTRVVRAFYRSAVYPFLIAILMAVSEIFALELPVYYIYLAIGAVGLLLCEDALCILPIACCSYMTFAYKNNPEHDKFSQAAITVFSDPSNLIQLIFILAVAVVLLIGRLLVFQIEHPTRKIPALSLGFLLLLVAYMLAGVGFNGEIPVGGNLVPAQYEAAKAIPFALLQVLSLCVFYFYFYFTVDWKKVDKSYIFTLFIAIGVGLLAEIGEMYTHKGAVVFEEGVGWKVDREKLVGTGWGIYNNVGCVMAMCVPAPFYFAAKNEKWGWAYSILGCVFVLGVALTQSRGAILFGAVVFIACVAAVLTKSKGMNRILNAVIFCVMIVAVCVSVVLFTFDTTSLVGRIFDKIRESLMRPDISSGRIHQYAVSWELFKSRPIFGVGFHNIGDGGYSRIGTFLLPRRVHNTILQLLASGGLVALFAYLFHRGQTLWIWFKKPNFEKTMAAFIIGAMLLTSLLDCHIFNYGPGLLYGCVLVYIECCANFKAEQKPL